MNALLSDDLWPTLSQISKRGGGTKRAAVAYITSETYLKFGRGDLLITDACDAAISSGQTSAEVLQRAYKRGAKLFSLAGLHSKVLLLGSHAVIGSANFSESSASSLIEAAWVTDNPGAVGMSNAFVEQLVKRSQRIDDAFLSRILAIEVKMTGRPISRAKINGVKVPTHRTWIVGVYELTREDPREQKAIETGEAIAQKRATTDTSDLASLRFTGTSRFRQEAKQGDTVIQLWSHHRGELPHSIYRHAPILHRQDEETCTRFFVEQFSDADETSISWARFKRLIKQVGLPERVGPGSARPISDSQADALFALWNT